MRISTLKLSVVGSLMAAIAMAGAASASADTTSCTNSGTVKLSPGLEATPHVQNITVKGVLTGCSGVESTQTEGKYVAHMKTAEAVSCSALTGVGAAEEATNIVIKWTPKGGGNSMGSFTMPLTEAPGVALGGTLASGPFSEDTISGTVSQTYTGGPTCGVPVGKKKAKRVNKGTVSGTLSIS
jgi:hypothetical protein